MSTTIKRLLFIIGLFVSLSTFSQEQHLAELVPATGGTFPLVDGKYVILRSDTSGNKGLAKLNGIVYYYDGYWKAFSSGGVSSIYTDTLSVTTSLSSIIASPREYNMVKNSSTHSLFKFSGANIIQNPNYPASEVVGADGLTSQNGSLAVKIEFIADSRNLQFWGLGYGGTCEVWANDTLVTKLTMTSDGNFHYFNIAFKTRRIREITIYNSLAFGKTSVEQGGSIYRTKKLAKPKAIIMGDSFTEPPFGYTYYLGKLMGWDTWNSGSGSTGWVSNGTTGRVNFTRRLQNDVIDQKPDIVMINGGINDAYGTQAEKDTFTAHVQYCITQIRTQLPKAQLYITGAFYPNGYPLQGYIDMRNEQQSICNINNMPYLDNSTWLTGSTGDSTTGNAYYYTGPDGTHPSEPLGAIYLAERMAETIKKLTPTITAYNPLTGNFGIGTALPQAKLHVIADSSKLPFIAQANGGNDIAFFKDRNGNTVVGVGDDGGGKFYAGSPNGQTYFIAGSQYDAPYQRLRRSANTLSRPVMTGYLTNNDSAWYAGIKGESRRYTIAWGVGEGNNTAKFEVDSSGNAFAKSFIKSGGTSSQILAADGSVITAGAGVNITGGVISATTNVYGGSISSSVTAVSTFVITAPTQANNTYQVVITPSNMLSAVNYYVTNKTTTSFDVVFMSALTGTVAFDWILKP